MLVEAIAAARAAAVPITAETCPHDLMFAAEEIVDGATDFTCASPIRASSHREALWQGLGGGVLDLIAPGFDADLVVWNPDVESVVDAALLQQRHTLTPYAGRSLAGIVATTCSRGERVWDKHRLGRAYGGRLL